jgi:flagellar hook-associated protein 3 FlgL
MTIGVTEASAGYGSLGGLQDAAARLAAPREKLSSRKQITVPSDDPSGTVEALQLRADLKRNTQYTANANDATSWMSASDSAYSQIVKLVQSARTLVVQGLNAGVNSASSSSAIADQIDGIRTSLIGLANTTCNGRPVFGGTTTGATAYDATGAYLGDGGTVLRAVGPQSTVQINQTGTQVFGVAGSDIFSVLSGISTALRANPSTLASGALASLDTALSRVSSAQAAEGAVYQRVQVAQAAQTSRGLALRTQLSGIQAIDVASMAIQVSTANTNFQAALQTTASIRQLSLLDFLH